MRRIGILFVIVGLAGFLFATSRSGGDAAWETVRWLFVGCAVMGVVLTILPGKDP
jgi:hypothetical protein